MKKTILILLACPLLFAACSTNAVTGRKQLSLLPESQLQQMADQGLVTGESSGSAEEQVAEADAPAEAEAPAEPDEPEPEPQGDPVAEAAEKTSEESDTPSEGETE